MAQKSARNDMYSMLMYDVVNDYVHHRNNVYMIRLIMKASIGMLGLNASGYGVK